MERPEDLIVRAALGCAQAYAGEAQEHADSIRRLVIHAELARADLLADTVAEIEEMYEEPIEKRSFLGGGAKHARAERDRAQLEAVASKNSLDPVVAQMAALALDAETAAADAQVVTEAATKAYYARQMHLGTAVPQARLVAAQARAYSNEAQRLAIQALKALRSVLPDVVPSPEPETTQAPTVAEKVVILDPNEWASAR